MPRPHIEIEVKHIQGKDWVSKVAYDELLEEFKTLNADVVDLRSNKGAMLSSELEEIRQVRQERLDMKAEIDRIALFIREHYKREIELGQHNNMKTIADVVMFYMGRERRAVNSLKWWKIW
jgi:uncharacterized protein YdcH (DUF465 family)